MINGGCPYLNYVLSAGYCIRGNGRIFSFCVLIKFSEMSPREKNHWPLRITRCVSSKKHVLFIRLQHLGSPPVFSGFQVAHLFNVSVLVWFVLFVFVMCCVTQCCQCIYHLFIPETRRVLYIKYLSFLTLFQSTSFVL